MLHQTAREGDISLDSEQHTSAGNMFGVTAASPYGGAGSCSGVAGTAITTFDKTGRAVSTVQLSMSTLAVDVAQAHHSTEIAVAMAGAIDPFQPTTTFVTAATPEEAKAIAGSSQPTIATDAAVGQPPDAPTNIVVGVVRYDLSQSSIEGFGSRADMSCSSDKLSATSATTGRS